MIPVMSGYLSQDLDGKTFNAALAKKYCYVFPRYVVINKGEKNQDIEKFLWTFNDCQNKGYLYAGSLVGRKEGNSYEIEKEF